MMPLLVVQYSDSRTNLHEADENSIFCKELLGWISCIRIIIAMSPFTLGLLTRHLARASRQGVGLAYKFVGEFTITVQKPMRRSKNFIQTEPTTNIP